MKTSILYVVMLMTMSVGCQQSQKKQQDYKAQETQKQARVTPVEAEVEQGLRKAYFASGCFWCVEPIYESLYGVENVISGYSGGHTKNPTYKEVVSGKTGHAETIEVVYDPQQIDFKTLVEVYFNSQNVTQVNGQGPDSGSQYRSIIFYQNSEEKEIAQQQIDALNATIEKGEVAAQLLPFEKFWKAEAEHQNFKKRNPNNRYILNVSNPRFERFKETSQELLKEE